MLLLLPARPSLLAKPLLAAGARINNQRTERSIAVSRLTGGYRGRCSQSIEAITCDGGELGAGAGEMSMSESTPWLNTIFWSTVLLSRVTVLLRDSTSCSRILERGTIPIRNTKGEHTDTERNTEDTETKLTDWRP